jgi:predicted porin
MQKKLIAVAVGSALSAIGAAPALAQNATVNVYGTLYAEYASIDNGAQAGTGASYQRYDHFQNPGSEIGFRGEEKLGGGMSAWFQCASSMDYRGGGNSSSTNNQTGSYLCSRNSALGMKGAFGNIFYGNWQTPFTRVNLQSNTGANDTGVFGNAHIMTGTSSTFGMSSPQQGINTISQAAYRRRQNNLMTYETPNFSGFTVMGAFTSRNNASSATAGQLKSRLWSIGGQYANGPLYIGLAYEKHQDMYNQNLGPTAAFAPIGGDDQAWHIGAAYTFANRLKLGGQYNETRSDAFVNASTKVKTWHIGIDWMISGPHGIRAAYSHAGDVTGGIPTTIVAGVIVPGTPMNLRPNSGGNTSADMWQIRYVHQLSKRTELTIGYSRTNNSSFATYETGGSNSVQFIGSDSSAFAAAMRHTF